MAIVFSGMGYSLEFLVVTYKQLTSLTQAEIDFLDIESKHTADFSLQLVPKDLDVLSEICGQVIGTAPLILRSHMELLIDGEEGGMLIVQPEWIRYMARVPEGRANEIVKLWVEKLVSIHNNHDLKPVPAMKTAVCELIQLCKVASSKSLTVVHRWCP